MNKTLSVAITCFIYAFSLQSSFAEVPVIMSGPAPAIGGSFSVGSSNTFTYTITNNVPKRFPITVSGISGPVSRVTVANDCGGSLPAGPATCNLGVLIAPTTNSAGQSFNQNFSVDYQGRIPLVSNIQFSVPGNAWIIAGGQDNNSLAPLLAQSTNNGTSWAVVSVPGNPTDGVYNSTSCSAGNAICIAAGQDLTGITPLLAQSTNNGASWVIVNTGITDMGTFCNSSCTGSGSTAICIAGGIDNSTATPLLVQSKNSGASWGIVNIGTTDTGEFCNSSCTGSGSTAMCIAAGQDDTTNQPLLAQSTNGGNTWTVVPISSTGVFNTGSCTINSGTNFCIAAGHDTSTGGVLLTQSTNGGATWTIVTGISMTGEFDGAGCTGSLCIAVGRNLTGGNPPLIVETTNGGASWAAQTVTGAPSDGLFVAASCTGSGATAICVAVGETGGGNPILAQSTDGGASWAIQSITGLPADGLLSGISCTGSGTTAICTAAGSNTGGTQPPLLVQTTNGGASWSTIPVAGAPVTGYFNSVGSSTGLRFGKSLSPKRFGIENVLRKLIHH